MRLTKNLEVEWDDILALFFITTLGIIGLFSPTQQKLAFIALLVWAYLHIFFIIREKYLNKT